MHRNGHYGASLLAYSPLGFLAVAIGFPVAAVGGGVLAVALAMVPDWDQRIPGVAHRGVTHTVYFAAVVAVPTGLLGAGMAIHLDDTVLPGRCSTFGWGIWGCDWCRLDRRAYRRRRAHADGCDPAWHRWATHHLQPLSR